MKKSGMLLLGLGLVGLGLFAAGTNEVKSVAQGEAGAAKNEQVEHMAKLLREANLGYEITKMGDFRVTFKTGGDRLQFVYINPYAYGYENYKAFYIYSVGYGGRLTKAMSMQLLMSPSIVGSFRVQPYERVPGSYEVLFAAQVPEDILAADLKSVCGLVASQADLLESEWTDGDKY